MIIINFFHIPPQGYQKRITWRKHEETHHDPRNAPTASLFWQGVPGKGGWNLGEGAAGITLDPGSPGLFIPRWTTVPFVSTMVLWNQCGAELAPWTGNRWQEIAPRPMQSVVSYGRHSKYHLLALKTMPLISRLLGSPYPLQKCSYFLLTEAGQEAGWSLRQQREESWNHLWEDSVGYLL